LSPHKATVGSAHPASTRKRWWKDGKSSSKSLGPSPAPFAASGVPDNYELDGWEIGWEIGIKANKKGLRNLV
jgi:hypothetical protein